MFVPRSHPVVPPIAWTRFLPRLAALAVLALTTLACFHLAEGASIGPAATDSLLQAGLLTLGAAVFAIWARRDRFVGADPDLTMEQRVEAAAASWRGPVPRDLSVRREALRLARISHEAAIKGLAARAVLVVIALGLEALALVTSPWWWGDAVVAALLVGLSSRDLRRSRERRLALEAAPMRSEDDD